MKPETTLVYDGSFNGFLTAVFDAFDQKLNVVDIQRNGKCQNGLFSGSQIVFTQVDKAKRVWNGIGNKSRNALANVYFAFLSEAEALEPKLYSYIQNLMRSPKGSPMDHTQDTVSQLEQLARKVGREKHRMEALTQFQKSQDNIQYALINPDYNVLPLISKHFRSRHPDQSWLIYDLKRAYGIFYDGSFVEMVTLDPKVLQLERSIAKHADPHGPHHGQGPSVDHFRNRRIKSSIRPKLHARTIPKHGMYGSVEQQAV